MAASRRPTGLTVSRTSISRRLISFTPFHFSFAERFVKREGAEQLLPGLSMNQNQLFWLSAANTWCSKYRPKSLEQRIKTGAHSPGMFRVKGPFSNSREFSTDFQCKLGSGMNPVDKCEVW